MQVSTIQISAWTKRWTKGIFFLLFLEPGCNTLLLSYWPQLQTLQFWCMLTLLLDPDQTCARSQAFSLELRIAPSTVCFWGCPGTGYQHQRGFSIQTDYCSVLASPATWHNPKQMLLPQLHLYPILVSLLPNTVFNTEKALVCTNKQVNVVISSTELLANKEQKLKYSSCVKC